MHAIRAHLVRNAEGLTSPVRALLWAPAVAALCYLAARLGGALILHVPQTVWPLWPGCAALTGVLLLAPRAAWPVLLPAGLAGFVVYDAQVGVAARSIVWLIFSDTLEVTAAAWGITRVLGRAPRLDSLRSFAKYSVFALILAPLVAASVGASAMPGDYWTNWRIAALSEALAFLTVTPAMLGWVGKLREQPQSRLDYLEAAALLAILLPLCYVTFVAIQGNEQPILLYSLVPFLLWFALRFGSMGVSTAASVIAFVSIWGAVRGRGPFIGPNALDNVLSLQVFLFFAATPFMALALLVEEHSDAQRALEKSQEKFAKAFRASPMALALTRANDGRYIDVNSTFEQMSGYSRQEVIGRTALELNIWMEPNQRLELTQRLGREGGSCTVEAQFRMKSGRVRTCLASAELIEIAGEPCTLFVVADISDRKQAEEALSLANERLRLAMESSKAVAWDWDVRTGQDQWFGDLQTMFGISADTYRGCVEDFRRRIHPEDRGLVWKAVQQAMKGHEPYAAEFRVVRPDNTVRWVSAKGDFHYGPDGSPLRMVGLAVDVTARKEAEQALRESVARERAIAKELRVVLDTAPVGIFIANDGACTQITANRAGYELLGAQADANVSKTAVRDEQPDLRILRDGKEVPPNQLPIQVAAATGHAEKDVALTLRFGDSTERHVLVNATPLIGDDGLVRGAIGTVVDVTDRIRAEHALQASDERFRFAAQAGRMFAYDWDLTTDVIIRSEECAEILGLTGDVSHTSGAEVAGMIHPEDYKQFEAVLAEVTPARPIYRSSIRVFRPDGEIVWLERTGRAFFDEQGKPVRMIGMAVDITDRKRTEIALRESEERLRMAARAGRMYAYEWDVASDAIVRSPECVDLLGPGAPARTTRSQFLSYIHPDDHSQCDVSGVTPQNPTCHARYRIARQDGTWMWAEKTARAFFDEQGKLVRMIGMIADVTEQKEAEEALASLSRKLIEAHEAERTWIARELHDDINQRLALAAIDLEQLTQNPPSTEHEIRRRVRGIWERVSDIANDIQALSHRFHSSKLEYLGIVAAAGSFCREMIQKHKVEIDFRHSGVPDHLPREIALCLFRVLQESLHNAIKNSGVRYFRVELRGGAEDIQLTVSDSGQGFDPEEAMKSYGLGLISMRERLHLVNGEISIDSQPNRGTRIHARVPVAAKSLASAAG